jgi:hypothetical protein
MSNQLFEYYDHSRGQIQVIQEANGFGGKDLYMKGIFIQADIKNQNQRVYPLREISKSVQQLCETIKKTGSVCGELDHPETLSINLDKVSHCITDMWMEGNNGMGKLKIFGGQDGTPCGKITESLIKNGVKLGVSSRGSGNVGYNGEVSDFVIVTVDIVAQPSAPEAYPKAIYESLFNMTGGARLYETAIDTLHDSRAQTSLDKQILSFIKELKLS